MGASDYTDGGGWAKLDATAAAELTDIIKTFPPSKIEKYTLMLLTLFASTNRSGAVTMGFRTLAERCGVHEQSARRFLAKLENDGVLVSAGQKVTATGKYIERAWFWLVEGGVSNDRHTHVSKSPAKSTRGVSKSPGFSTHIRYQKYQIDGGGSATAAPPPNQVQNDCPPKPQEISNPLFKQRADLFLEGGE